MKPITLHEIRSHLLDYGYHLTQEDFQKIFYMRCKELIHYLKSDLLGRMSLEQARKLLDGTGIKSKKGLIRKVRFSQEVIEKVFETMRQPERKVSSPIAPVHQTQPYHIVNIDSSDNKTESVEEQVYPVYAPIAEDVEEQLDQSHDQSTDTEDIYDHEGGEVPEVAFSFHKSQEIKRLSYKDTPVATVFSLGSTSSSISNAIQVRNSEFDIEGEEERQHHFKETLSLSTDPIVIDQRCHFEKNGYCRMWHVHHQTICTKKHYFTSLINPFGHTEGNMRLYENKTTYKKLKQNTATYDYIKQRFLGSWVHGDKPKLLNIKQIVCPHLEVLYDKRRDELSKTTPRISGNELYHGTCEANLKTIFSEGFIPPTDYEPHPKCPYSGKYHNKLSTSLCKSTCELCRTSVHKWNKCHMFGLGVYFASDSSKSDQYVSNKRGKPKKKRKLLVCSVMLGNSEIVESLKMPDEMHDRVLPKPGKHSIYAIGWQDKTIPRSKMGDTLGVKHDEYVIFHPHQALPLYLITYEK